VYQIVQAHDGKIFARSAPGKGSEFIIELKQVVPNRTDFDEPSLAASTSDSPQTEEVPHG
jgi:hypothetical protein